ncbi:MAG TPA: hypothetical protein VFP79_11580 [Pseudolabrys sp.]|jgi:hypothetical protein|nr:hypothetical protein [Pseudolabrys sp.]
MRYPRAVFRATWPPGVCREGPGASAHCFNASRAVPFVHRFEFLAEAALWHDHFYDVRIGLLDSYGVVRPL